MRCPIKKWLAVCQINLLLVLLYNPTLADQTGPCGVAMDQQHWQLRIPPRQLQSTLACLARHYAVDVSVYGELPPHPIGMDIAASSVSDLIKQLAEKFSLIKVYPAGATESPVQWILIGSTDLTREANDSSAAAFQQLLHNADPAVRLNAVLQAYGLAAEQAIALLSPIITSDPDPDVRLAALEVLSYFGPVSFNSISAALSDPLVALRWHALEVLIRIDERQVIPILGQMLLAPPSPQFKALALSALSRNPHEAAQLILANLPN